MNIVKECNALHFPLGVVTCLLELWNERMSSLEVKFIVTTKCMFRNHDHVFIFLATFSATSHSVAGCSMVEFMGFRT